MKAIETVHEIYEAPRMRLFPLRPRTAILNNSLPDVDDFDEEDEIP